MTNKLSFSLPPSLTRPSGPLSLKGEGIRLFAFFLFFCSTLHAAPRLAVIVVIDQFRADYLDRYAKDFTGGFRALGTRGTQYTHAKLNHVPTETAPGHATIITGQPPSVHGIIGNDWFDRSTGKTVLSIDDPDFEMGPGQLRGLTLGDALKTTDSSATVVAISYKDRAAIMLGGKKADAVVWYNKKAKGFVSSKAYPSVSAWLDKFNANHPLPLNPASFSTDRATFELAKNALEEKHLGEDDHSDLLAVSFSATDYIGHLYGPNGGQMREQILALDQMLNELIAVISKKTAGNFVLALTSDHGVLPIPESIEGRRMGAKRILVAEFSRRLETLCQSIYPAPGTKWIMRVSFPDIYFNKELVQQKKLDWGSFLLRIQTEMKTLPDVEMVYLNNPLIQQDKFSNTFQRSNCPGRSGDLTFRMKEGVLVTEKVSGTSHGSTYDYDAAVPLFFYGKGFGATLNEKPTTNEIIAPTLAKELGVDF